MEEGGGEGEGGEEGEWERKGKEEGGGGEGEGRGGRGKGEGGGGKVCITFHTGDKFNPQSVLAGGEGLVEPVQFGGGVERVHSYPVVVVVEGEIIRTHMLHQVWRKA